jgi:hypothetical protein
MACISQIFGAGQTRKTGSGDSDAHADGKKLKPTLKGPDPHSLLKVVARLQRAPWLTPC